ncbi:MAG TPA: hypothetical protein VHW67_03940 [Solirubrobacteraceae bacterium]|jgi:hypothetical protein|nr:hypothetical protein [Solirubrobacteraceae bacterium]
MTAYRQLTRRLAREDGFTMLFALLALFVGSLLVAAAFTAANGDVKLSNRATIQAKAYYAAVAGVDRYQYQLTNSPEYWTKCPAIGTEAAPLEVTGAAEEKYSVKTLGATGKTCESGKQATILETTGTAKGTFRILSTGTVKEGTNTVTRRIVATFAHPGFTKYVYESNYEVEDPVNFNRTPATCEHYYEYRKEHRLTTTCPPIEFAPEDEVNGPMHTNDAAEVCTSGGQAPTFGRENYDDEIAMLGGHYAASGCSNTPTIRGKYTESAGSLLPPATDVELLEAAGVKYNGRTEIELKTGSPNMMKVTNKGETTTVAFPSNGVLYVENSKSEACGVTNYTPFNADTTGDTGCGNVYVHGEYTESLTIASADDVIVNGNLKTTTESNGEPTGAATLGLIAENFVRVYHPVKQGYTTTHIEPATEPLVNGKCVTMKELSANVLRSNEVTGITTTGLAVGAEVVGTVAGTIASGTTITEIKSGNKIKLSSEVKPPATEVNNAKITKSTEVEVATTGLVVGEEVEGPAGQIEAGTTITEIKAGNKIKLSKAAKPGSTEPAGKITNNSTEVKEISTTGLAVGQEVEGTVNGQIEAGTTITEIKTGNKIKLSKAAKKTENTKLKFYDPTESTKLKISNISETIKLKFYGETTKLKFYVSTGYVLNSSLNECHKVETGYSEYRESENLYIVRCENNTTYSGNALCKYENDSEGCSEKVTNLNASEDPNKWGSLENPVIDAAILSTNHSWIVDNYDCGKKMGNLTVWGSIAQFWRGPVGTGGGSGTGYIKSYNYDNRLADQQPPSFLSPTNASSWKVSRETAPPKEFTG